jgi:hypothetical protein
MRSQKFILHMRHEWSFLCEKNHRWKFNCNKSNLHIMSKGQVTNLFMVMSMWWPLAKVFVWGFTWRLHQAQSTKGKRVICIGVVFGRMAPCEGDGMEKLMGKNEKTYQSVNLVVFVLCILCLYKFVWSCFWAISSKQGAQEQ